MKPFLRKIQVRFSSHSFDSRRVMRPTPVCDQCHPLFTPLHMNLAAYQRTRRLLLGAALSCVLSPVAFALKYAAVEHHLKADPAIPEWTPDRKSTRLNSSHANISYAVFCLKK